MRHQTLANDQTFPAIGKKSDLEILSIAEIVYRWQENVSTDTVSLMLDTVSLMLDTKEIVPDYISNLFRVLNCRSLLQAVFLTENAF